MTHPDFIDTMAGLLDKHKDEAGIQIIATPLAQAILESNFGTSILASRYHNYFGMKCGSSWTGDSVNMRTREEYRKGQLTNVSANFRVYSDMEAGVKGYFDFINTKRYSNLKTARSNAEFCQMLKDDGWATDSSYVTKLLNIIQTYNLSTFDKCYTVVEDEFYQKCDYKGNSLIDALNSIGVDSSKEHRKLIALANGIPDFKGTATQNTKMLKLLKAGQLRKEN